MRSSRLSVLKVGVIHVVQLYYYKVNQYYRVDQLMNCHSIYYIQLTPRTGLFPGKINFLSLGPYSSSCYYPVHYHSTVCPAANCYKINELATTLMLSQGNCHNIFITRKKIKFLIILQYYISKQDEYLR